MALASSSQEVMFLRQLLPTIGSPLTGPTSTFEDNESCIALASNDMTTSKSKHIDIKYHYIRDLIKQGSIRLIWCPTDEMLADILTKFSLPSSIANMLFVCLVVPSLVPDRFEFHGGVLVLLYHSRHLLCTYVPHPVPYECTQSRQLFTLSHMIVHLSRIPAMYVCWQLDVHLVEDL
jgi:hypothetical protein